MQLTGALEQRLEDLKARLVQFAAVRACSAQVRTAPADGEALAPAPPTPSTSPAFSLRARARARSPP